MPVIDCHEHIIPRRGFIPPDTGETFITAAEMVGIMDRHGMDRTVALPVATPDSWHRVQSMEEVFEACDLFPGRFIKFCNPDPRVKNDLSYDFLPLLEYYKSCGAVGLGEITANMLWDDPRVQNLLRGCETIGFPVIFHITTHALQGYGLITEPGLGGLERALQRFPRLRLLGHSQAFWAEVGPTPTLEERRGYPKGPVGPGGRLPELMRKYPNLWGDLSAGSGCNAVSRDPEWGYKFIEEFQDRLLMGLDLCVPSNEHKGGMQLLAFLREAVAGGKISRAAFNKIMGGNAVRLLNLE